MSLIEALGLDAHLQFPRIQYLRSSMIRYIQVFHSRVGHQQRYVTFNDTYTKCNRFASNSYRNQ